MDFAKPFSGHLLQAEKNEFTDSQGKSVAFYRLEVVAEIDGQKRAMIGTCGVNVFETAEIKPGSKLTGVALPGNKTGSVKFSRLCVA